ncbi:DUF6290 family protein [Methylomonas rivi]|uniref:Ribbon-helix-helix domain-containing protein n=1 Tax=Methylomonas rivi TaxID=2952226 RepID=A0ABT1U8D9_9GAMM|nr:DUF6290 family protein [Methylomonas sp. WSC-6]MCQ8129650.1 ribbon-helix-helix domain-containing protein [Methylomonas sp. WSC-6]
MMTLDIDDDTASLLRQLSEQEHVSPAQLIKHLLSDYLEDLADVAAADTALAELLSGKDDTISLAEWEQQLNAMEH